MVFPNPKQLDLWSPDNAVYHHTKLHVIPVFTVMALDHFTSRKLQHSTMAIDGNGCCCLFTILISSGMLDGEQCEVAGLKTLNEMLSHGILLENELAQWVSIAVRMFSFGKTLMELLPIYGIKSSLTSSLESKSLPNDPATAIE